MRRATLGILYAVILEFFIFSAARDLEFYCWGSLFLLLCLVVVVDEWSGGGAMKLVRGVLIRYCSKKNPFHCFGGGGGRDNGVGEMTMVL